MLKGKYVEFNFVDKPIINTIKSKNDKLLNTLRQEGNSCIALRLPRQQQNIHMNTLMCFCLHHTSSTLVLINHIEGLGFLYLWICRTFESEL